MSRHNRRAHEKIERQNAANSGTPKQVSMFVQKARLSPEIVAQMTAAGLQSLATYRILLEYVRGGAELALAAARDPRIAGFELARAWFPLRDDGGVYTQAVYNNETPALAFMVGEKQLADGAANGVVYARIERAEDGAPSYVVYLRHLAMGQNVEKYVHTIGDDLKTLVTAAYTLALEGDPLRMFNPKAPWTEIDP